MRLLSFSFSFALLTALNADLVSRLKGCAAGGELQSCRKLDQSDQGSRNLGGLDLEPMIMA